MTVSFLGSILQYGIQGVGYQNLHHAPVNQVVALILVFSLRGFDENVILQLVVLGQEKLDTYSLLDSQKLVGQILNVTKWRRNGTNLQLADWRHDDHHHQERGMTNTE